MERLVLHLRKLADFQVFLLSLRHKITCAETELDLPLLSEFSKVAWNCLKSAANLSLSY